jgi:hypothetical protein
MNISEHLCEQLNKLLNALPAFTEPSRVPQQIRSTRKLHRIAQRVLGLDCEPERARSVSLSDFGQRSRSLTA